MFSSLIRSRLLIPALHSDDPYLVGLTFAFTWPRIQLVCSQSHLFSLIPSLHFTWPISSWSDFCIHMTHIQLVCSHFTWPVSGWSILISHCPYPIGLFLWPASSWSILISHDLYLVGLFSFHMTRIQLIYSYDPHPVGLAFDLYSVGLIFAFTWLISSGSDFCIQMTYI